jgi:peptidoglycan/LPS O-acetylase OafA/YrhL
MRPASDSNAAVSPYIPALDGIRALAILLVIPHNISLLKPPYAALMAPFSVLANVGWIGVQLFFVLSGFLITGNLLDTRGSDNYYRAFIARRALRIMPLYFGVLLVAMVIVPAVTTPPPDLRDTLSNQVWLWTFLSNWTAPYGGTVSGFSHFWSLAVEEQFYLLWPFVIARCRPPTAFWVCLGIAAVSVASRFVMLHMHAEDDALYMFTNSRMDALALGAATAAVIRIPHWRARLERMIWPVAIAVPVVLLIAWRISDGLTYFDRGAHEFGYTVLALAFALVVLLTTLPVTGLLRGLMRLLAIPPLRLVGRYSYGMYIFHLPLHMYFGNALIHHYVHNITNPIALGYSWLMVLVSFIAAALSYELIERRFLSFKQYFMPRSAPLTS